MNELQSGTLLIVDDEKEIVEILALLLKPTGLTFIKAYNGAEALDHITSNPKIDAVLADIHMPIMNGLKLLSIIRNKNLEIPFVFLTAYGDKENVVEALRLGAIDFIDKPFKSDELIKIITKLITLGQILKSIEVDIDQLSKESEALIQKRKKLSEIKRSMLGGFFLYRKIEMDSELKK